MILAFGMKINTNYLNLKNNYLFYEMQQRINLYKKNNPSAQIISLGIGDVTLPLCKAIINEMKKAVAEMGVKETFKGYGPSCGQLFLKESIKSHYLKRNINLKENEIFISDGAKTDISNLIDIFDQGNIALIPDPVYPVYLETNIMHGNKIKFIDSNEENNFLPMPNDNLEADIIYICSPNNPTGAVYNKNQLEQWVAFALQKGAIIVFDAAYEAFISNEKEFPRSIFEIKDAKFCAIEVCSLSKTAGFTGLRCGYTIIPDELKIENISVNQLWKRRQNTKFNGASYIAQRGANAVFTDEGQNSIKENINYYKENAKLILNVLKKAKISFTGGKNSPYIWIKCPKNMASWDFFDYLLRTSNIIGTPGAGFGKNGEGYFRLTCFGDRENIKKASKKLQDALQ